MLILVNRGRPRAHATALHSPLTHLHGMAGGSKTKATAEHEEQRCGTPQAHAASVLAYFVQYPFGG
eukprot:scaffold38872_cov63-Phaeocystis_antarctica.AAC.1